MNSNMYHSDYSPTYHSDAYHMLVFESSSGDIVCALSEPNIYSSDTATKYLTERVYALLSHLNRSC